MDVGSLKSLRWALAVGGALGLLCTVLMLVVNLAVYCHSRAAASFVVGLPSWAVWGAAPPSGVTMLLAGALCALLLVVGRWPVKACAALVAVWFAYAQWGFGPDSTVMQRAMQTLDMKPLSVAGFVSVAALLVVSGLAVAVAAMPAAMARRRQQHVAGPHR